MALVWYMLSFRPCEASKSECEEGGLCTDLGLRGDTWEEIETWECYALGRHVGVLSQGKKSASHGVWISSKLY